MDEEIANLIWKFADDTKLLGQASNDNEIKSTQQDIDKLVQWSEKWDMPFNISKCKVMHFGRKNKRHYLVFHERLQT